MTNLFAADVPSHPVIVTAGSRDPSCPVSSMRLVHSVLGELAPRAVFNGKAPGYDQIVEKWCRDTKTPYFGCPAYWEAFGDPAGPIRNQWLLTFANAELVVLFPGGTGTASLRGLAEKAGYPTLEANS